MDNIVEEKIYVAVGKYLKESMLTLQWAIDNSEGRKICILHVHQPAEKIPILGISFRIDQLEERQVAAYREMERQDMHQLLDKYTQICQKLLLCVEVQHIKMDSIEKGIVEFILEHNVKRLVMGGAADRRYLRGMDIRSSKAIYVRLQATASCQIQFICKGNIIFTKYAEP